MSRRRPLHYAIVFTCCALFVTAWLRTPTSANIRRLALGSDHILLSANGQLLQTLRTDFSKRRLAWSPLASFPDSLRKSIITAEDRRFFWHFGFDPIGLARALWADLRRHPVQGASTITMQLTDLIQDDVLLKNRGITKGSFFHKIAQIGRAVMLEIRWSKSEILEAYLNLIHLRGEFQGVPAVSFAYLNKHPIALDDAESAVIASMISSPNQKLALLRQKACALFQLTQATDRNAVDCSGVETAAHQFFNHSPVLPPSPGSAPHLARRLFKDFPEESVVTSTIDVDLQRKVVGILAKNMERLKNANVHDSAAIVIDNKTGKVLAYVGAVETSTSPHVDGVQSYRQAGSTLKPFLYGQAIATKTLTAASILLDDPTAISWGNDVYRPANYEKHFYGPVTVREALASSLNVPAVKTVTILGLHPAYQVLQSIGLTNLREPDFYGVSLALGAVEVRLEDLANAYRMLANGGEWSPLVYSSKPAATTLAANRRVFPAAAPFVVSSILSDPNARAIGFGWENPLETPFWTAVKTGTSKDYRDNWCVGFSEHYTVAVWAGNFDATAMENVSGVSGVGPSWFEIMNELHSQMPSHAPSPPSDIVMMNVRPQWESHAHPEAFLRGTEPAREVIEPAPEKRVQFIFPAEGSVLVIDPHLDPKYIALFIRFKGTVPPKSRLFWDDEDLGEALSPFKIANPATGTHRLRIVDPHDQKVLTSVHFRIR